MDDMFNKKIAVDLDSDGKSDFKIDFKTLAIVGGMIITMTMSYTSLKSEIEVAKTMPQFIEQDDTRVINQKMDYLIKEMERFEADTQRRLENLEDKVYKK
tara:strand:- start:889 stop:1188 length:300 start_codon:yes stop_codon:yes gene_type:complete